MYPSRLFLASVILQEYCESVSKLLLLDLAPNALSISCEPLNARLWDVSQLSALDIWMKPSHFHLFPTFCISVLAWGGNILEAPMWAKQAVSLPCIGEYQSALRRQNENLRLAFVDSQPAMWLIGPGSQFFGIALLSEHKFIEAWNTKPTYVNLCPTKDSCYRA